MLPINTPPPLSLEMLLPCVTLGSLTTSHFYGMYLGVNRVNSLRTTYMCHQRRPSFFFRMTCYLFDPNSSPETTPAWHLTDSITICPFNNLFHTHRWVIFCTGWIKVSVQKYHIPYQWLTTSQSIPNPARRELIFWHRFYVYCKILKTICG